MVSDIIPVQAMHNAFEPKMVMLKDHLQVIMILLFSFGDDDSADDLCTLLFLAM
jgi:hypothetical protein